VLKCLINITYAFFIVNTKIGIFEESVHLIQRAKVI